MKHNKAKYIFNTDVYQKKLKGLYLFFNPLEVKSSILVEGWERKMALSMNGKRTTEEIVERIRKDYPLLKKRQVLESIENLSNEAIIYETNISSQIREKSQTHITFWISLTDQCNFRCTYCFIKKNAQQMNITGYSQAIKNIEILMSGKKLTGVRVHYSGGEPLLNLIMLRRFHEYFLKIEKKKKITITETVLTNGSLVNKDIVAYLKKEKILASVSLDGLKNINDKTRIDVQGNGTFSRINKGLQVLKKNNLLRNVDIVVSSRNYNRLGPLIEYLLSHQIPFVLNFYKYNFYSGNELTPGNDPLIRELKKIYKKIYSFYVKNDLENSPLMRLQLLDLVQFSGKKIKGCGAGDTYFTIRTNGSVDKCPLIEMYSIRKKDDFSVLKSDETEGCAGCQWRYMCGGGCSAEKWIKYNSKSAISEYCKVYKTLIPYLLRCEGEFILQRRIQESMKEKSTKGSQGEDTPYRLSLC